MIEMWKDIPGFDGLYQASTYGNIRNIKLMPEGIIKYVPQRTNPRGYKSVQLTKGGKCKPYAVHRLVALTFLPLIEGKDQVDHIDGNPSNNHVENLRWCTRKENMNNPITIERERQAIYRNPIYGHRLTEDIREKISRSRMGRFTGKENPFYGKKHTEEVRTMLSRLRVERGGIAVVQLSLQGEFIGEWQGAAYAAKKLGISSPSSITECCRGKRKTIGGFKWKYLADYATEKESRD